MRTLRRVFWVTAITTWLGSIPAQGTLRVIISLYCNGWVWIPWVTMEFKTKNNHRNTPKEKASVASEYSLLVRASGAIHLKRSISKPTTTKGNMWMVDTPIGPKFCMVTPEDCSADLTRARPKSETYTSDIRILGLRHIDGSGVDMWRWEYPNSVQQECYGQQYLYEWHAPVKIKFKICLI